MKSYAIILGGGSGRRMEADRNKVFLPLRGIPAIVRAIAARDGDAAYHALKSHISKAFETRLRVDAGELRTR